MHRSVRLATVSLRTAQSLVSKWCNMRHVEPPILGGVRGSHLSGDLFNSSWEEEVEAGSGAGPGRAGVARVAVRASCRKSTGCLRKPA